MTDCPHMTYRCCCGAQPNSPDCRCDDIAICDRADEPCGYEGDPDACPERQQDRADAAELLCEDRRYEAAVDERAEKQEATDARQG